MRYHAVIGFLLNIQRKVIHILGVQCLRFEEQLFTWSGKHDIEYLNSKIIMIIRSPEYRRQTALCRGRIYTAKKLSSSIKYVHGHRHC